MKLRHAWLALALLFAPYAARANGPNFDYYVLTLSLAPAFCEDEPRKKRRYAQCRALSAKAFVSTPLTLHGLWPNRRNRQQPTYCAGTRGGAFCSLAPVPLADPLRARLDRMMPARADCLDRYQWAKHGSCAGVAAADYFGASVALADRVNRAIGVEVAKGMGGEIDLAGLRRTLARRDPKLLPALTFDCRTPRTPDPAKRRPMLREVRVYFERDAQGRPGAPLPFAVAGARDFQSGCPHGRAYIDSPLD